MKRTILLLLILSLLTINVAAENKTALVIGNGSYSHFSRLGQPVGEARQMSNSLKRLGFEVILLLDASEDQMIDALTDFEYKLKDRGGLALFHYGGHGVQVDGENYLIPVDANIPDERRVRSRAVEVDEIVGSMEASGSTTNIVILDACRDNPLPGESRSGTRGLAVMSRTPPNTIVVYSAAAGATAQDGLFTPTLLEYLETPGMRFTDVLQKVRTDVRVASGNQQRTGEYNQLENPIYLAGSGASSPERRPGFTAENPVYGEIRVSLAETGDVYLDGERMGQVRGGGSAVLNDITTGRHDIEIRYDGHIERRTVTVSENRTAAAVFRWIEAPPEPEVPEDFIYVDGGTFQMGSTDGNDDEKPVHTVTVSDFMIGKYEVTQGLYEEVMGTNPSDSGKGIGDNYPVNEVSWYDAVSFCNKLSEKEGLEAVYRISGNNVTCDWSKNGYRLPTEAEWEFAARGGNHCRGYTWSGSSTIGSVAWYSSNSGYKAHPVGGKSANELGIYDMTGNVFEWCWDWYGSYSSGSQRNPRGASSGSDRVLRGGSWNYSASNSRTAYRIYFGPSLDANIVGFRLLLPAVQ